MGRVHVGANMRQLTLFLLAVIVATSAIAVQAAEVTVTDQAGRTVVVKQPVERVVTTFIPATLFALCSGLQHNLVGASNKDGTSSVYEALIDHNNPPTLVGNRTVGLNLETIVSLKPDLVIMYGQKDGVRLADRLTAMSIPAIVIMPESMADMKTTLELIGRASGRTAHTDRVIAAMSEVENTVRERVRNQPQPKVYYATSNLLRTISGNMLQNEMITLAGGTNVSGATSGFFVTVSREQLVTWNPEVLLCSDRLSSSEAERINTPEFASITAVRNKQILKIPPDTYWDFPSPLAMAGVLWMSGHIHPERYRDMDVQDAIDDLYDVIFGSGFAKKHPAVVGRQL